MKKILKVLSEITDYGQLELSKIQMKELENRCAKWEDTESIEAETNTYLIELGYIYKDFIWTKPKAMEDKIFLIKQLIKKLDEDRTEAREERDFNTCTHLSAQIYGLEQAILILEKN